MDLQQATEYLLELVNGNEIQYPDTFMEQLKFESAFNIISKNRNNMLYFTSELNDLQKRNLQ